MKGKFQELTGNSGWRPEDVRRAFAVARLRRRERAEAARREAGESSRLPRHLRVES